MIVMGSLCRVMVGLVLKRELGWDCCVGGDVVI